jgi:hypothetical protein
MCSHQSRSSQRILTNLQLPLKPRLQLPPRTKPPSQPPPRTTRVLSITPTPRHDEAQHCHLPDHPDPVHPDRSDRVPDLLPPDADGGWRDSDEQRERHDECCVDTSLRRRCKERLFMFTIYGDVCDAIYAMGVAWYCISRRLGLFIVMKRMGLSS